MNLLALFRTVLGPRQKTAEAKWHESTIAKKMRRQLEEYPAIIDRYYANPCPETFAPLKALHEQQRQEVVQIKQARDNLRLMASDTEVRIEKLRQKAVAARAAGNPETADSIAREQEAFGQTLVSVQESLEQAEETLAAAQEAFARAEARMAREAVRFTDSDG
jgi:predicted  nucleic acid-binding Zn-ribbon protein